MKKPNAILFDMGDTLISYRNFNPLRGTKKIIEYADNPRNISAKEVQDFANVLNEEIDDFKNNKNIEISCRSFQNLIFGMYGLKINKSPLELEMIFKNYAWESELIEGVIELLNYLKDEGIRAAILSNSSFSEEVLRLELQNFKIEDRFEFVISTANYCLRKPDKRIFRLALAQLDLKPDEVWYIGDSYKYDVIGASSANIQPIWFNINSNKRPIDNLSYYEVKNHNELINLLKNKEEL